MPSSRVLVVEDDARLRATVAKGLALHDLQVDAVGDGRSALERCVTRQDYAAIVLDVGLGDSDGRDVCQALRSRGIRTPVLFLTARGQVADQLSAFAAGGDDFLAKPFHFDVLMARLTALLRRSAGPSSTAGLPALHLDPQCHALALGDRYIPLTPTEYRVLGCLLTSSTPVVRRRELVTAAWPIGAVVSDNSLDQYITRLRRKLLQLDDRVRVIAVHGVGYRLEWAEDG